MSICLSMSKLDIYVNCNCLWLPAVPTPGRPRMRFRLMPPELFPSCMVSVVVLVWQNPKSSVWLVLTPLLQRTDKPRDKPSYRVIWQGHGATRFIFIIVQSQWNLTSASAAMLPKRLSNFDAIGCRPVVASVRGGHTGESLCHAVVMIYLQRFLG